MNGFSRPLAVCGVVMVAFLLAGCTGQGAGSSSGAYTSSDARQGAPVAPGQAAPVAPTQGKAAATAPGAPPGQVGVQDRKLVRTANLKLTASDVRAAVDSARQIAIGAGGYTGQEHSDAGAATVSLAVPSDKLDASLDQLARLGDPVSREQSAQDVTDQVVDVDSRLATQRASVERIRALLAKAVSVGEIASVEGELTTRESELESLERRRDALAGSVAMSTITLTITAKSAPPAPAASRSGFLGGLSGGWHAFVDFGSGVLTVLGAVAPFLLILGVPAAAGFLWWRRRRVPAE